MTQKISKLAGCMAGVACMTAVLPALAGDKALAEDLFRKAQSVMQRPKTSKAEIHQACQWYKESLDQDATQNTQVALAACWEKEGKTYSAWGMYTDAASGTGPAAEFAKGRAAELQKAGFLKLKVEAKDLPEGTKVTLDGSPMGEGILNTEIGADPGEHKLEVRAPGKKDFEKKFELNAASSPLSVPVTLEDAPVVGGGGGGGPPPPIVVDQPMSTVRLTGLIVGGVGIASGMTAAVMGILTLVAVNNRNANLKGCMPPASEANPGTNPNCSQALQYKNQALGFQTVAIITGIGAGVLLTTGIVLFIVGGPKKQEASKTTWNIIPSAGPEGGGALLVGTF